MLKKITYSETYFTKNINKKAIITDIDNEDFECIINEFLSKKDNEYDSILCMITKPKKFIKKGDLVEFKINEITKIVIK
ncbi:MAG: hypothetical protein RSB00_01750 [Bacilli bacterium]